jgi:hypothetical protein
VTFWQWLTLAREVRELIALIAELIQQEREEEAAAILLERERGRAAGRAAYEASRRAGRE